MTCTCSLLKHNVEFSGKAGVGGGGVGEKICRLSQTIIIIIIELYEF